MWKITLRILCSFHYTISDNKMNKRHSINEEQSVWLPNMHHCFLGWRRKHFICVSFIVFNTIYNFTLISPSNFYLSIFFHRRLFPRVRHHVINMVLVNWRSDKMSVANRNCNPIRFGRVITKHINCYFGRCVYFQARFAMIVYCFKFKYKCCVIRFQEHSVKNRFDDYF